MAIESLFPVERYLGDGVQTEFPVGFPFFGDGRHVRAVVSTGPETGLEMRELVYAEDYVVREVSGGGECATTAPVPADALLTLYLEIPVSQPRDFDNLGRLDAEEIEKGMDYLTALAAQNAAALARAIKVPIGDPRSPEELLADFFAAREETLAARDETQAARDEACECAMDAAQSADKSERNARMALAARKVAIMQNRAMNRLMAAELAKINLIADALREDAREMADALRNALNELRADVDRFEAGVVNSVNGIAPDEDKNTRLDRAVLQEEFDALDAAGELVPGATYYVYDAEPEEPEEPEEPAEPEEAGEEE